MTTFALVAALMVLTAVPALANVTTLSDGRALVVEQPLAPPRGIVLLIPGGDSMLIVHAAGNTVSQNFVMRTRDQWLTANFVVAFLNDPSGLREPIATLRRAFTARLHRDRA